MNIFSGRTPKEMHPNRLAKIIERKRKAGEVILDLTESNPTRAGFDYQSVREVLTKPIDLLYEPDPKGLQSARSAVAQYYSSKGVAIDTEKILLTASTSEGYTMLFKLLCEPGDRVLVPVPSYPLFDHLAHIECVSPVPYPLYFDGEWHIDFLALSAAIDYRTRAIVVVSPNNPTGSILKKSELENLIEICCECNLALICDEVFADYVYGEDSERAPSAATVSDALSFTLNGLSKIAGLPQMKLGWIAANGPEGVLSEAVSRLEFITDLFLSVATPVQKALPDLLNIAPIIQKQIMERTLRNRARIDDLISPECGCSLMAAEGGWYASIQTPRIMSEEDLAMELLEKDDVLAHPGYFFDFASEGIIVLSLLTKPEIFDEGAGRLFRRIEEKLN